jgi:hypothetical protein
MSSRFYVHYDFKTQIWRHSREECIATARHLKLADPSAWVECYEVITLDGKEELLGFYQLKDTDLLCECGKGFSSEEALHDHLSKVFTSDPIWDSSQDKGAFFE